MKIKFNVCLCIIGLLAVITLSNCATTRQNDFSQFDFSLKDTLSIYLLNDENGYYFCIPLQYLGDYQLARFEFDNGNIRVGDYDISLKRDKTNISVYLNETANEDGNAVNEFNLIYQEENGKVSASKMAEPLAKKNKPDMKNHYYIFIEKHLTDNEMKKIAGEYKKGNVHSRMSVWFNITVDNEEQNGSGMLDDFELCDGFAINPDSFPSNLNFFKAKYLQK